MADKVTTEETTAAETPVIPIHGNWEEERSFGQQSSTGPQKQYELCPPASHRSDTLSSILMPNPGISAAVKG